MYSAIILLGLFGGLLVTGALVVSGDALATTNNISASPLLWRAGIIGDHMMQILDVPVLVIFYVSLRRVNASLALFAPFSNPAQTVVLAMKRLNLLVPLFVVENAGYLKPFSNEPLQTLSYFAIKLLGFCFAIGLRFPVSRERIRGSSPILFVC